MNKSNTFNGVMKSI